MNKMLMSSAIRFYCCVVGCGCSNLALRFMAQLHHELPLLIAFDSPRRQIDRR